MKLPTVKTMCPAVVPIIGSVFVVGIALFFNLLLRQAILALDEARVELMLDRVEQSAASAVAKLARDVAISCLNNLLYSLAAFALAPWYLKYCAVGCDLRRSWDTSE